MPLIDSEVPLNIHQSHLDQGRLAYQYSPEAGRAVFPPRLVCPFSGSDRLEWRISAGGGTVYSCTTISPKDGAPYCVVLVDMDEGFRLMSRVRLVDAQAPRIGARVRLSIGKLAEAGENLPLFDLEEPSHA